MTATTATGGCLCGGVRYRVSGRLREVIACHCSQCRRTSGNFVTTTNARAADLHLTAEGTLAWYASSKEAERGFCTRCGGNLFWRRFNSDTVSITAGTLDLPTGVRLARHIFVADKSDYFDLTDGLPQHAAGTG